MGWGWYGWRRGPWPGNGPFSWLPPWERPGWILGRGWCWSYPIYGFPPATYPLSREDELRLIEDYKRALEEYRKYIEEEISRISAREKELKGASSQ
ncbi:MAG: hypothetical protein ABWK01_03635 [Infirmifilum sp.]